MIPWAGMWDFGGFLSINYSCPSFQGLTGPSTSPENHRPCFVMRKWGLFCHREIVSMIMNLDENLCILGQPQETSVPPVPAHLQANHVLGVGQPCEHAQWNSLDSQGGKWKSGLLRMMGKALHRVKKVPQPSSHHYPGQKTASYFRMLFCTLEEPPSSLASAQFNASSISHFSR